MKIDKIKSRFKLSLESKDSVAGYLFVSPFILGFVLLFLYPFFQSILFSLSELSVSGEGFSLDFVGLSNYNQAVFVDPEYLRLLSETVLSMLRDVPAILTFSFFAAILLNQKFRGRILARVIFFLPVIMAADVVLRIEQADYMSGMLTGGEITAEQGLQGLMLSRQQLTEVLMNLRLPEVLLQYIVQAVAQVPDIIRSSGIQILIFLAGLQSIPASLYEAADVEGATSWENFWMITLPMLSPLIVTNIVYTIIDFFTSPANPLVEFIEENTFGGAGYGVSMAMSWIYFIAIAIILTISLGIISRWVFYQE
ncbi:MAG: carbohydrate ABC transporter permease [Bacillota bacterium]